MMRVLQSLGICVCLSMAAVPLGASAPEGHKNQATDFFSDRKVAELAEAAAQGELQRVDALIAQGADVKARGQEGMTPLIYAISGTGTKGFQRLLERGANPNRQLDIGHSAISLAAGEEGSGHLTILLAHGGNANLRSLPRGPRRADWCITRPTPIFDAIGGRSPENVRILLKAGADLEVRNDGWDTPVLYAAFFKRFEIVHVLLEAGADFRRESKLGETVARFVLEGRLKPDSEAEKWRRKCMEFLERRGVDFAKEKALCDEMARERQETRKRLDENLRRGEYTQSWAVGSDSAASLLLSGVDPPLYRKKLEVKDFFADPKVAELAEAAARGDVGRVHALLAQGVNVNSRGEEGITALIYAMSGKSVKGFQGLLERGADPNQHTDCGESAMKWAAFQNESEHLRILLAHGGNPNLRYPTADLRATPLHWAASGPCLENARILIKAGADATARDVNGTAMKLAAWQNRFDMVYAMLEAGADFRPKDPGEYRLAWSILGSTVDPTSEGEKWRQKCIEFMTKKGVDFEKERQEKAKIKGVGEEEPNR